MWRAIRRSLPVVAVILSIGCLSPLYPDSEYSGPKDPGQVIVQVRDQSTAPVRDAYVTVEMPNNVGSFFKEGAWTGADGIVRFFAVPAGRRPVEVKPPSGLSAGGEVLLREIDVVKGESVTVEFRLHRN